MFIRQILKAESRLGKERFLLLDDVHGKLGVKNLRGLFPATDNALRQNAIQPSEFGGGILV